MRYEKPALTYAQQIELLKSRGLEISSEEEALHWLEHIGYYRLSAYFLPFKETGTDQFRAGSTFQMIRELYQFDARLRLLMMQAIDMIEVSIRASLTFRLSHQIGPFGYTSPANFSPFNPSPRVGVPAQGFDHVDFMSKVQREVSQSKEDFVSHYKLKYAEEPHLPFWMVTELLTFGTISKMVAELPKSFRKQMAKSFHLSQSQLVSWLRSLAYVRNLCAHHARLWNRDLSLKPELLREWDLAGADAGRAYVICLVLYHFLQTIRPTFEWREGLVTLMDQFVGVDITTMGFPADWRERSPWLKQR